MSLGLIFLLLLFIIYLFIFICLDLFTLPSPAPPVKDMSVAKIPLALKAQVRYSV